MIPTPHIEAKTKDLIAKTVLMPGDPLRAKFIAEKFLKNVITFNSIRGMLGYTGYYNGRKISVMGSGMGMPSIGIYSYELYKFYDVEQIIRIGSCGAYSKELKLYDVIITKDAYSESSYAKYQNNELSDIIAASTDLNDKLIAVADRLKIPYHYGTIHSSDIFYREGEAIHQKLFEEKGCLAVEMESFALFHNANTLGKKAACLLTVSDSLVTHEATSSYERQVAFEQMMKIALEMA